MNIQNPDSFSYDPFSKAVLSNPVPYYKELRANHPAYYVEKYDMFAFTRFQDVIDVLGIVDDNTFVASESSLPMPEMISHRNNGAPPPPSVNPMAPGPTLASPQYEEMRLAHIKPLRPKAVQELQSFVRDLVLDRLNVLLPRRKFDVMAEYGGMVSAAVTCHLFDIPLSETQGVLDAVNALSTYNDDIEAVNIPGMFEKLRAYIIPAIERRRAAGADGRVPLIDGLLNYRTNPETRALSDVEISDQLVCSFVANTETPPKPAGQGLLALAQHPDQLASVRADLDANVPIVAEEMLRICTTAQWTIRTAHKDVTVAGQHIKAGQRVLVSPFSAARDEREFENADQFVWNRNIRRSLTFGYGQHHCIGNHIARLQIRMLVREFLSRVTAFEFDMAEAEHSASYFHWGYTKLPVLIKSHRL
jgi:cytochrome P450